MSQPFRCMFAAGLVGLAALAGCGGEAPPPKAPVKGAVTLDGKKLEAGTIQFLSADRQLPTTAAAIQDGAYAADVHVGKMRVQISAPKVVGKRKVYDTPDSPVKDVTKEMIPDRYNVKSDLTADVKAGENTFDFELKTGK